VQVLRIKLSKIDLRAEEETSCSPPLDLFSIATELFFHVEVPYSFKGTSIDEI
jgi:hypothetical protein